MQETTPPPEFLTVCPDESELSEDVQRNLLCPVEGCGRMLAHSSSLRFHLVKVHQRIQNDGDARLFHSRPKKTTSTPSAQVRYHCPVSSCHYNPQMVSRYFATMKRLKQHYTTVHAEKKYVCTRCGGKYGRERDLNRHKSICEVTFVCATCQKIYNTKEALQVHCRRNSHPYRMAEPAPTHSEEPESTKSGPSKTLKPSRPNQELAPGLLKLPKKGQSLLSGRTIFQGETKVYLVPQVFKKGITTVPAVSVIGNDKIMTVPVNGITHRSEQAEQTSSRRTVNEQTTREESETSAVFKTCAETSRSQLSTSSTEKPQSPLCASIQASQREILGALADTNTNCSAAITSSQPPSSVRSGQRDEPDAATPRPLGSDVPDVSLSSTAATDRGSPGRETTAVSASTLNTDGCPEHLTNETGKSQAKKSQLLLPKPSAVFLPIKLQLEPQSNYYLAGQNGPLIFVTETRTPTDVTNLPEIETQDRGKKDTQTQTVASGESETSGTFSRGTRRGGYSRKSKVNVGSQTHVGKKNQSVTSTQTTGDYILRKAMQSANLPVQKQSQASQVSPCARLKRSVDAVTQEGTCNTEGPSPRGLRRKRKRRAKGKETGIQTAPWKQTVSTETFSQAPQLDDLASSMPVSAFERPSPLGTFSDFYSQIEGRPVTSVLSIQTDTSGFDTMTITPLQSETDLGQNRPHPDSCDPVLGQTLRGTVEVGTMFTPPLRGTIGVGTMSSPPPRETVGVGTMPSPPLRETIGVGTMPSPPLRETVGVGTMPNPLRETIGVGTMPSPPLRGSICVGSVGSPEDRQLVNPIAITTASTSTGTDSLSLSFSTLSSRETQTSFWEELEATLAESISTQTLRSFLADASDDQETASLTFMDNSVQTTQGQSTETQTWDFLQESVTGSSLFDSISSDVDMRSVGIDATTFNTDNVAGGSRSVSVRTTAFDLPELRFRSVGVSTPVLSDLTEESPSRSVGVGTSFFDVMESQGHLNNSSTDGATVFEPIMPDVLCRSVGIDAQLFDNYDPNVSSTSSGICTPVLDNFETIDSRDVAIGTSMFSASASNRSTQVPGDVFSDQTPTTTTLQFDSIATASVQTDVDSTLPNFLTTSSQTTDLDTSYMHTQTQTMDEMFSQFLSNMETQTSSDFLSDFGFTNTETQTPVATTAGSTDSLQGLGLDSTSVQTQTTFNRARDGEELMMSSSMDMETQTLFPELDISGGPLMDSHTQTPWDGLESLIGDLDVG